MLDGCLSVSDMKKTLLTKSKLLELLAELERSAGDFITIYVRPSSFPDYAIDVMAEHGIVGELREALNEESLLQESKRYQSGSIIFWSLAGIRHIVLPPFPVIEDRAVWGDAETSTARELLKREPLLGIVLVTWGSYALGVVRGDQLIEQKTGTGYIHKQHRKGGRSQKRFARRTEEQKNDFLRRVANRIEERFRTHSLEYIFFGGNRLIIKPLLEECPYLETAGQISGRFFNVRHADRGTLLKSVEAVYRSLVFSL
jgi:hypothetical protein